MVIQEYADGDLDGLVGLMNQWADDSQCTAEELSASIALIREKSDNKIFIVKNETGKLLGYAFTGICYHLGFNTYAEVFQLLVDENSRSLGIGAKLIEHVGKYYKSLGIDEIKLSSRIERVKAHDFYRRIGFTEYKQSRFFEKKI